MVQEAGEVVDVQDGWDGALVAVWIAEGNGGAAPSGNSRGGVAAGVAESAADIQGRDRGSGPIVIEGGEAAYRVVEASS